MAFKFVMLPNNKAEQLSCQIKFWVTVLCKNLNILIFRHTKLDLSWIHYLNWPESCCWILFHWELMKWKSVLEHACIIITHGD